MGRNQRSANFPLVFPSSPHPSRGCCQAPSGGSAELREVLQQRVTRLAEELMKHDVELQDLGISDGISDGDIMDMYGYVGFNHQFWGLPPFMDL